MNRLRLGVLVTGSVVFVQLLSGAASASCPGPENRYSTGIDSLSVPYVLMEAQDLITLSGCPDDWRSHTYFVLANSIDLSENSLGGASLLPIGREDCGSFNGQYR